MLSVINVAAIRHKACFGIKKTDKKPLWKLKLEVPLTFVKELLPALELSDEQAQVARNYLTHLTTNHVKTKQVLYHIRQDALRLFDNNERRADNFLEDIRHATTESVKRAFEKKARDLKE